MKAKVLLLFGIWFGTHALQAQQSAQFTQYMLNELGMNPAYTGERGPLEFIMGRRSQWIGFPGNPHGDFVGVNKALGKKGFYRGWHGVGAYVSDDNIGLIATKSVSLLYAYHIRLAHNFILSAGISVGFTQYNLDGSLFDGTDPALYLYPPSVFVFPVINPGIRLHSKKVYFDFSLQQITANRTVNVDGVKGIGVKNRLWPNWFFTFGKRFESANYAWTFMPSIQVRSSITFLPTADVNLLVYYHHMLGAGISYRNQESIAGMIQFRLMKDKIILGLSYDFVVSRVANGASKSEEAIFGVTPNAVQERIPSDRIAQCPGFDL
ncbi:MAG TPA: PorP/SprF family type IX secretion system membrane protein [Bacteroidia bacterium]|jgi:type IX secretion system PorP/SprF family membrane protein|nr:PorP/SprF family type IX secretion system membrane protein [Bacteroidia bacterium]